jgi:tRNA pseudouridine55 synthase
MESTGQIILINKSLRWTSFDVVKKVRNLIKEKKVGHAGTLDPLATGLLILCSGKMTKQISGIQADEKEYTGTFTLGATTPSFDLETTISNECDCSFVTETMIADAVKSFVGMQQQLPPVYSAVKVNGKRAYESARAGEDVVIAPKEIEIKEFEITAVDLPQIHFRVVCTKGTYIRTLANDFGKQLGCGAYLAALCRTRIGEYLLKDALSIEAFEESLIAV